MKKNLKMDKIDKYLKGKEIELFVSIGRSKILQQFGHVTLQRLY